MPRPKSALTEGRAVTFGKIFSLAQKEKFQRLGGAAWLRKKIDTTVISAVRYYPERETGPLETVVVRMTAEQRTKLQALGGINFVRHVVAKE